MILPLIQERLALEPAINTQLAHWNFASEGRGPAIFTMQPAPRECGRPNITIRQLNAARFGTRDQRGGDFTCEVGVWGDKKLSERGLRQLAEEVWRSLDRSHVEDDAYEVLELLADPPIETTDAEDFPGFLVIVNVKVLEKGVN